MFVVMRERGREREAERERDVERERGCVCVLGGINFCISKLSTTLTLCE